MKIAFFGGTFDPVHRGHLALARTAAKKFALKRVFFAPANIPPHKQTRPLADFQHRFAMLAIATADDFRFVPSLIDASTEHPSYSYETVVRLKRTLSDSDKLFFLIGVDAFKEIATWHKPVELLDECDFIIASRPGFSLGDVARALPEALRPPASELQRLSTRRSGAIGLRQSRLHLLNGVDEPASSTQIRAMAKGSIGRLRRYVPPGVAEYIKKERLYIEEG